MKKSGDFRHGRPLDKKVLYPPNLTKVKITVEVWFFAEMREGENLKKPSCNYHKAQIGDVFCLISIKSRSRISDLGDYISNNFLRFLPDMGQSYLEWDRL